MIKSDKINYILKNLAESLKSADRDDLYRYLWFDYVRRDVLDYIDGSIDVSTLKDPDTDIDTLADIVAERYVYDGDYDCNISYWDNIGNIVTGILSGD